MSWTMDDARSALADEVCGNCHEYKGMTDDPDTGERYCVFCE